MSRADDDNLQPSFRFLDLGCSNSERVHPSWYGLLACVLHNVGRCPWSGPLLHSIHKFVKLAFLRIKLQFRFQDLLWRLYCRIRGSIYCVSPRIMRSVTDILVKVVFTAVFELLHDLNSNNYNKLCISLIPTIQVCFILTKITTKTNKSMIWTGCGMITWKEL